MVKLSSVRVYTTRGKVLFCLVTHIRGVACLRSNVRNCGNVVNAFMQIIPKRICGVSLGSALFATLSTFLVIVDNIKSYMNQDIFHFVNGC